MSRITMSAAALSLAALFGLNFLAGCPGIPQPEAGGVNTYGSASNRGDSERSGFAPEQSSYETMSPEEKTSFLREKALAVLKELGTTGENTLSDEAVAQIKKFVDSYSKRARLPRSDDCSAGGWIRSDLTSVLDRGARAATQINSAFRDNSLAPHIGLYIAMIETEFCPCLQSPTGLLGIYQFTTISGKKNGLNTKSGASPEDPDERCDTGKASIAEAKQIRGYLDALFEESRNGSFGKESGAVNKDSAGTVLLAVMANNMGMGSLTKALKDAGGSPDVWNLIENSDKLSPQFQNEASKYVPKFIAAAIVGENPERFGIKDVKPLSTVR
jgi:hypothetical protein